MKMFPADIWEYPIPKVGNFSFRFLGKTLDEIQPMILNVIDTVTGLVVAQMPIKNKDCEIKAIPEVLKLLDIRGSIVTTDAVGTQTQIMEQILSREGHFVLMVKKNQPQSYGEIVKYFGEMSEDKKRMKENETYRPRYPGMQEKYEEISQKERNRDREEYRWYSVCTECSLLTKTQKEWPFVKTVGLARQIRIPVERDGQGNDMTPDIKTFLEKGSRRRPKPVQEAETGKDIQETGMIRTWNCRRKKWGG